MSVPPADVVGGRVLPPELEAKLEPEDNPLIALLIALGSDDWWEELLRTGRLPKPRGEWAEGLDL
jgi:hypothetical protein